MPEIATTPAPSLPTPADVAKAHEELATVRRLQAGNPHPQGHDSRRVLIDRFVAATKTLERAKPTPTAAQTAADLRAKLEAKLGLKADQRGNFAAMLNGVEGEESRLRRDYAIALGQQAQELKQADQPAPGTFTTPELDLAIADAGLITEAGKQHFTTAADRFGASAQERMAFAWALRDSPAEHPDVLTADEMSRRVDNWGWSDEKLKNATRAWDALGAETRRELNDRRGGRALMEQLAKLGERLGSRTR